MPAEPLNDGRQTPAWIVSAVVHAGLLVLAVLFLNVAPRGAADEPDRQVGVVLKQATPDGTLYEGPAAEPATPDASASQPAADSTAEALPEVDTQNAFEELLPQPLGIGSPNGAPAASQMTEGGGGRPAGGAPGVTRTRVFNVQGEGRRFVYVFDRSASMVHPLLASAKAQLIASLESLESIHEFHIFFFNHSETPRSPDLTGGQRRLARADERSKRLAADFVNQVTAEGGTNRHPALVRAMTLRPDVIFFLTDADNPMTSIELQDIAKRNHRGGATICTIEFGIGPPHGRNNFLVRLASMTGGQYGYVDTTRLGR